MAKPNVIELPDHTRIPIVFEDRSVLVIDKPSGWMLAPESWTQTGRNLFLALLASMRRGEFWAQSRQLNFLRFVHRLDADTSGLVLFAKSAGALREFSTLFASRRIDKVYLAVVSGVPTQREWTCRLPLAPDSRSPGKVRLERPVKGRPPGRRDQRPGVANREHRSGTDEQSDRRDAESKFRVIESRNDRTLIEARPITGRMHQLRVHLAASGNSVVGDRLYGPDPDAEATQEALALRAVELSYIDPFQRRRVHIRAPADGFKKAYGF